MIPENRKEIIEALKYFNAIPEMLEDYIDDNRIYELQCDILNPSESEPLKEQEDEMHTEALQFLLDVEMEGDIDNYFSCWDRLDKKDPLMSAVHNIYKMEFISVATRILHEEENGMRIISTTEMLRRFEEFRINTKMRFYSTLNYINEIKHLLQTDNIQDLPDNLNGIINKIKMKGGK